MNQKHIPLSFVLPLLATGLYFSFRFGSKNPFLEGLGNLVIVVTLLAFGEALLLSLVESILLLLVRVSRFLQRSRS